MDSIGATSFMPTFNHSSFPTADDTFTSELRDEVISNTFNNYSNTLLVNNNTTKPNVIGCFNIPNLHYCMFEYSFRDPKDTFPLGALDTAGFLSYDVSEIIWNNTGHCTERWQTNLLWW